MTSHITAPILLFVYNRPLHTQRCIDSLRCNSLAAQSHLFIYSDGAKDVEQSEAVEEVRQLVKKVVGFASVTLIEREENWGLARNIIDGVSAQIACFGRVIVLEDDLVVSPYFLKFMNEALEVYADEPKVGHIQACDFTQEPSLPDTFLIKWTGSWGWATWDRAWKLFNPNGQELLNRLEERRLTKRFDFDGAYRFTRMLRRQVAGKNNSWAIRWNASLFLADVLSLNVGRSLVQNTGFDGSGTHCGNDGLYASTLWKKPLPVAKLCPIAENEDARQLYARYYRRTNGWQAKIVRRLKAWLGRLK